MSFLDHIRRCNNAALGQVEPWFIGTGRGGSLRRGFAAVVTGAFGLFSRRPDGWQLSPDLDTPARRSAAMRTVLLELRARGHFAGQWRDEDYPVVVQEL